MGKNPDDLIREVEEFTLLSWSTPNTYCQNYQCVPESSGVYMVYGFKEIFPVMSDPEIVYIGSSINLKQRYDKHEIMRAAKRHFKYVRFYFKVIEDNFKECEMYLIRRFKPLYNTQHTRG